MKKDLLKIWKNIVAKPFMSLHLELLGWEDDFGDFVLELFHEGRKKVKHFLDHIHILRQHPFPKELEGRILEYQCFNYIQ